MLSDLGAGVDGDSLTRVFSLLSYCQFKKINSVHGLTLLYPPFSKKLSGVWTTPTFQISKG